MAALVDLETVLSTPRTSRLIKAELKKEDPNLSDVAELGLKAIHQSNCLPRHLESLCNRNVEGVCHSTQLALQYKALAAEAFKQSRFLEAASAYSQSLCYVGKGQAAESDELAATLLANRALSLIRMGPHGLQSALADCTQALQLDSRNAKARYLHIQTLGALGRTAEARQSASEALGQQQSLPADAEENAKLGDWPQQAEKDASAPAATSQVRGDTDAAAGSMGGGACPPFLSPAVSLRTTAAEGRHFVAAESILASRQLIAEMPFAAVLTKSHRKLHCWWCFRRLQLHTLSSCPGCAVALYCNRVCQEADDMHWPGSPLCRYPWPLLLPEDGVLAACIAARAQGNRSEASQTAELDTHFSRMQFETLVPLLALASLATVCWNVGTQDSNATGMRNVHPVSAGHVLRALMQIRVNGIAVVPSQVGSAKDRIALAVYPQASMLNHACLPNTVMSFTGRQLALHASRPIQEGEAVVHCYGPQVGEMIADQRRRLLEQQYRFTCTCSWCTYPMKSEVGLVGLKCSCCSGPLWPRRAPKAGVCSLYDFPPGGSGTCAACDYVLGEAEEADALHDLERADDTFEEAVRLLQEASDGSKQAWKEAAALRMFQHCLQIQMQLLFESNQRLGQTHDALGRLLVQLGEVDAARPHLQMALNIVEINFPDSSPVRSQQRSVYKVLCQNMHAEL